MGYRAVVVLAMDTAHQWSNDPLLGKKLDEAISAKMSDRQVKQFEFGSVAELVHADVQTLMVVDSYQGTSIAHSNWNSAQTSDSVKLQLLQRAAAELGYTLTKKPQRKG